MVRINNECYVSLEVAKLLKKAGFNWEVNHYYFTQNGKTELKYNFKHPAQNYNKSMATMDSMSFEFEVCSCPTLDIAQRWLREVKGYSIYPTRGGYKIYVLDINDSAGFSKTYELNSNLTYEESQESGIKKALELILEKGE
jgi:hypothetical protein